jgi:hypothetical protein
MPTFLTRLNVSVGEIVAFDDPRCTWPHGPGRAGDPKDSVDTGEREDFNVFAISESSDLSHFWPVASAALKESEQLGRNLVAKNDRPSL